MQEHYVDTDTQVAADQGSTWLNFALQAQCKQRPSGTRAVSRLQLPTLEELKAKAQNIIDQRQEMEKAQARDDEDMDGENSDQDLLGQKPVVLILMLQLVSK